MSSTPSIRISQHQRFSAHPAASPMGIPGTQQAVPPPLPPPPYIPEISAGQDPGWQWGNDPNGADFGRPASVKPGSSLLGGGAKDMRQGKKHEYSAQYDFARRGSSISTVTLSRDHEMHDEPSTYSDEEGNSTRPTSNRLQSERQLGQRTLEQSSQSYDKQLLSRIGGPNAPKRQSLSYGIASDIPPSPHDFDRLNGSLRPLSLPERRHASVDSPASARWPSSGAISPGNVPFWHEHGPPDPSRAAAVHRGSLASEDASSHRDSYDHSMFMHDDFAMEEGQMSNLNIQDRSPGSPKAGSKRRASSPPREREDRSSVSSASGHSEIYHRRSMQQLPTRSSPVSRFHQSSLSSTSTSSYGPRHGSLGSSLGISSVPSSATSYGSGRVSPGGISPVGEAEPKSGMAYGSTQSLNPSPNMAHHQRTFSESTQCGARKQSTGSVSHSRNGSLSQVQGVYTCECCPKKPKKFDTEDELRLHESEKQYMCNYCPNRFKNKNEAERHQNSLHLRRHSWSCAVLSGIEAAFHTASSSSADVCGYCGEEFPNPPQWDIRAEHLNNVHKFGECNASKKFFRADHFRQHLKHSHQGTSGKWTNMLETACMKDEPPPEKRVSPIVVTSSGAGQAPAALMVATTGLSSHTAGHGTIEETPHDT